MSTTTEGAAKTITASKPLPSLSSPEPSFATILVGSDQKRFIVHQSLLTHYSEFFRAALTGRFIEAKDQVVKLEDQSPRIFQIFVHWLYYQRFPDADLNDSADIVELFQDEVREDGKHTSTAMLIEIYVFADRHDVEKLRLATIEALWASCDCSQLSINAVEFAFEHLDPGTPLCRFLVDYICQCDALGYLDPDTVQSVPFLRALWQRYRLVTTAMDTTLHLCDYHEHATTEERKQCESAGTSELVDQ